MEAAKDAVATDRVEGLYTAFTGTVDPGDPPRSGA